MTKKKRFGSFGDVKPQLAEAKRFFGFWRIVSILFIVVLLAFLPLGYRAAKTFYKRIAEKTKPAVEILEVPRGLGNIPVAVNFLVSDTGAGLDKISIKIKQRNFNQELFVKEFKSKISEQKVSLSVDARDLGLREGVAHISVVAFDKSLWSNKAVASFNLNVDYRAPEIKVVTRQHNAVEGGVELVFYTLDDTADNTHSGVQAGEEYFPGFRARLLDLTFSEVPNLHFAFFSAPLGFNQGSKKIHVVAEDVVGNKSSSSFYYRVNQLSPGDKLLKLSTIFLHERLEETYKQWITDVKKFKNSDVDYYPAITKQERLERLRKLRVDYKAFLAEAAAPLFSKPKAERLWRGVFSSPRGKLLKARFGDELKETFEGEFADEYVVDQLTAFLRPGKKITASNDGVVIFTDSFGTKGRTVILDHGFGLTTLYSHLSSFECQEGDRVKKGQPIGRAGKTGLIDGAGYSFQIRLHGKAVRVVEWLDADWVRDHIESKVLAVKKQLGLRTLVPVTS